MLAKLLTAFPKLLLLDEPFSNLDAVHKNIIKSVIHDIGEKLNITSIMVSHDAMDTLSWANTILVMRDGQLVQQGTPEQIYKQPVNEYCAGLFDDYNLISSGNAFFLSSIPGISINGKQLLIRPEHFNIVENGSSAINGTIQNILFRGSYYTIDVLVAQQMIRVKTKRNLFAVGDTVYLSLSVENVWRL